MNILGFPIPNSLPNIGNEVYAKWAWGDSWQWLPFIYATEISDGGREPGTAQFTYRFGLGKRAEFGGAAAFVNYPYALRGAYVSVHVFNRYGRALAWVGKVEVESVHPQGNSDFSSGVQQFTAYDMRQTLDRRRMIASYTEDGWIERSMTFNEQKRGGQTLAGNKATAGDYFGADGDLWDNLSVLRHILTYHVNSIYDPLLRTTVASPVQWVLVGDTQALELAQEVQCFDGATPLEAINRLIDQRLGVGWIPLHPVDADGHAGQLVYLYVYSLLPQPVAFEDVTIPANSNQQVVQFAGYRNVQPEFHFSDLEQYDWVVARGGPVYTAGTFSYEDETLDEGWDIDTLETAYIEGSTADGAGADEHDAERNTDKYKNVFQKHRVPADWDGELGDGEGVREGVEKHNALPGATPFGVIDTDVVAPLHQIGKTFEPIIPFAVPETEDAAEPQYRDPFVLVKATNADDDEVWAYVNKLAALGMTEAGVQLSDTDLAIEVDARPVNHVAALNVFDPDAEDVAETNSQPQWDYRKILATLMLETDKRLQVIAPVPGRFPAEIPRVKVMEDREAIAWYVVPGTVIDITDGALQKHEGGVIRDDSARLRVLAARALAWFCIPRSKLRIDIRGISFALRPGTMIAGSVGPEGFTGVFTPVTRRTWKFSTQEPSSTMIETDFFDMDLQPKRRSRR